MNSPLEELEGALQRSLGSTVIGLAPVIRALTIALVARGHVLIQGAPGLGKTLLSKSLAAALGGTFRRIQGTSDLMPSDIIGVHVYDTTHQQFVFHPGPLFADVLLFDEINRTGPKTQSALLEAMEERQVSVDRHLYVLPSGFFVVATQNPREFEGTYPLPESQLDRFMLRIELSYPSREDERGVLARYGGIASAEPAPRELPESASTTVSEALMQDARRQVDAIHVADALQNYVLDLAQASREQTQISLGLSTRAALALLRAASVAAGLRGSDYVSPDDVKTVWPWVVPHRLVVSSEALLEGANEQQLAQRLLDQVAVPR
ncbi:MAG TPA: MoxR family ATPase [Steroidobacteraceae bacterium]|jgi:MoxR-like ATPase|nr:MoxR family ATPase [Steroidobacteraceae bacterium]